MKPLTVTKVAFFCFEINFEVFLMSFNSSVNISIYIYIVITVNDGYVNTGSDSLISSTKPVTGFVNDD